VIHVKRYLFPSLCNSILNQKRSERLKNNHPEMESNHVIKPCMLEFFVYHNLDGLHCNERFSYSSQDNQDIVVETVLTTD